MCRLSPYINILWLSDYLTALYLVYYTYKEEEESFIKTLITFISQVCQVPA